MHIATMILYHLFLQKKCEEYWPVNVGESVEPGHGLNVALTSMLPFAEYSVRKMTVTQVSMINYDYPLAAARV